MNSTNTIPWVEKYRPKKFDDIVMDKYNKLLLENVLKMDYFPNLLLYGPPGTGKTTTIINLINKYQELKNNVNKGLYIHLNASDERGIDTIRNQINQFVNSKPLFTVGMKFVILDEVDYMTKNAQQALKYLLQSYKADVKFCLICNYISKIDETLQNEFIKLRFNMLPTNNILLFLTNIVNNENITIVDKQLINIQLFYKSDIRSMINFLQLNYSTNTKSIKIMDNTVWENLYTKFKENKDHTENNIVLLFHQLSIEYNIDKRHAVTQFINYIIREKKKILSSSFLTFVEILIHNQNCCINIYIDYFVNNFTKFLI
jgi:DNA polymerase III delta prime subunit